MKFASLALGLLTLAEAQEEKPMGDESTPTENGDQSGMEGMDGGNSTNSDYSFEGQLMTVTSTEWGIFALGTVLGAGNANAKEITNQCVKGSLNLLDAGWNTYYFLQVYQNTKDEVQLAYAVTFLVKASEESTRLDCSNIEQEASAWISENIFGNAPAEGGVEAVNPFAIRIPKVMQEAGDGEAAAGEGEAP
jgi:hypothetical protein